MFVVEREAKKDGGGELLKPTHVITQRDVMRFLMFKMGLQPMSVHQRNTLTRHEHAASG